MDKNNATTKKIHDYFKSIASNAVIQATTSGLYSSMQGTATDHAQINDDEQQPNIDNGNSKIQQIKTTTEYDAEKPAEERQPPPPKTKANAASGKVKTKSKNRACNNPPSSTFFSWLKSLSTAFNPNIMANNVKKNNVDKNEAPAAVLPLPIPSENKTKPKSYEQTTTEQAHASDVLKTLKWNCRNLRLSSESLLLLDTQQ